MYIEISPVNVEKAMLIVNADYSAVNNSNDAKAAYTFELESSRIFANSPGGDRNNKGYYCAWQVIEFY